MQIRKILILTRIFKFLSDQTKMLQNFKFTKMFDFKAIFFNAERKWNNNCSLLKRIG